MTGWNQASWDQTTLTAGKKPRRRHPFLLGVAGLFAVVVVLAALGNGSSNDRSTRSGVTPATIQVGDPAVYAAIKRTTNCEDLQERFDQAMTQVDAHKPLTPERDVFEAYADAAYLQAKRSGCYS